MEQEWWHLYVNNSLLVSIKGYDSAIWAYNYFKKDTTNFYSISQTKKCHSDKKDIQPIRLQDIINSRI